MTKDIKLIALDLDGTLLNSSKMLLPRTAEALRAAAARGIEIVPTTGRFYEGMPDVIQKLPFVHYAITINGAMIQDLVKDTPICRAEIPVDQAVSIMRYLDTFRGENSTPNVLHPLESPLIYDCYKDNWGWITEEFWIHAHEYAPDDHYLKMIRTLRNPVHELKEHLIKVQGGVQKISLFFKDMDLRKELLESLGTTFPDITVSSSVINNIELNNTAANKGSAIQALAGYLGIPMKCTMAIGDGSNDLSMIRDAGIGVAMSNACEEVLNAADLITLSNDEEGVACVIETLL